MKLTGVLAQNIHAFDGEPRTYAGHKMTRIWFIVADRQNAHVYRKVDHKLELLLTARMAANHQSEGVEIHKLHDPRDQRRHHNDRAFMHDFSHWLDKAQKEKIFDELVIAAPPHTLGDMRASFSPSVNKCVMAEIGKDFMNMPAHEIYDHLRQFVWF